MPRALVALACSVSIGGCSSVSAPSDGTFCTALFTYGISVDVRDSTTGAALAGAWGTVQDGAYVDSLRSVGTSTTLVGAGERAGTYTVRVARSGYQPFARSGVVVSRDACHVQGQVVRAALVPSS